jgi:para-nitrobenzyl esterase
MEMSLAGWFALAALTLSAAATPTLAAPVMTDAGALQGVRDGSLTVYRGVPFAAPPVGDLRWRPPQPPASWTGVRRADAFAPACTQVGVSMAGETPPKVSEDCLYLNVWTPARRPGARLAVMVWFPGGGWTNGSASMPLYWGDQLARRGVIVVTAAYRLGPLGFLAHPELTAESPHATSGNYGLLDQIAALQWVQRNIGALGGDPGRVTIFGQSAGGYSVSLLMASPLARGLFQRAIGQSGGVFEPLQIIPDHGYELAGGERSGVAYAASVGAHSLAELRRLPAADLLKGEAFQVSHPLVEPYALPRSPYDAFLAGQASDAPVLIGFNAEEIRTFMDVSQVTAANFVAGLPAWFPAPLRSPAVLAAFPHATDAEAQASRIDLEDALRTDWDMWAWARLQAPRAPVYLYRFEQAPPFPPGSPQANWGAGHNAELWYMFGHLDQEPWPWRRADRRLASQMTRYWTNFAKTGGPNGPGLPPWPRFTLAAQTIQRLGDPVRGESFTPTLGIATIEALYAQARGAPFGGRP